jgi:hypothetical protein
VGHDLIKIFYDGRYDNQITTTTLHLGAFSTDSSQIGSQTISSAVFQYSSRTGPSGETIDIFNADLDDLASGSSVLAWTQHARWSENYQLWASIQNGEGTAQDFTVFASTNFNEVFSSPKVAGLENGRLAFTWTQNKLGAPGEVYVMLVDQNGSAITNPFVVSSAPSANRYNSQIEDLSNGNFVASWQSTEGGDLDAHARIFSANGDAVTADLTLNNADSIDQEFVEVAATPNGGFAAIWRSSNEVMLRLFDSAGKPQTPIIDVGAANYFGASVAALADGRVLVTWSEVKATSADPDVWARVYAPDGTPDGAVFVVNSTLAGYQTGPMAAVIGENEFKVAWLTGAAAAMTTSISKSRCAVTSSTHCVMMKSKPWCLRPGSPSPARRSRSHTVQMRRKAMMWPMKRGIS